MRARRCARPLHLCLPGARSRAAREAPRRTWSAGSRGDWALARATAVQGRRSQCAHPCEHFLSSRRPSAPSHPPTTALRWSRFSFARLPKCIHVLPEIDLQSFEGLELVWRLAFVDVSVIALAGLIVVA